VRSLILNPPGTDTHNALQLLTRDELYKLIQSHKLGTGAKLKQGKKQDYVHAIQSALEASNTTPNPVLVRDRAVHHHRIYGIDSWMYGHRTHAVAGCSKNLDGQ
jgi:hypothetical protein